MIDYLINLLTTLWDQTVGAMNGKERLWTIIGLLIFLQLVHIVRILVRQERRSVQQQLFSGLFAGTPYRPASLHSSVRPIDLSGVGFDQMKASVTERKDMAEIINDDTLLREAALRKTSDLDKNTFTGDDSYYRGMGLGGRKDFGPGSGN